MKHESTNRREASNDRVLTFSAKLDAVMSADDAERAHKQIGRLDRLLMPQLVIGTTVYNAPAGDVLTASYRRLADEDGVFLLLATRSRRVLFFGLPSRVI
jgi:hypothetical protein